MLLMGFEPAVIRLSFSIPTKSKNRCHKHKSVYTPDGTRTHNLWIRSPTPYPLGHRGWWFEWSASPTKSVILKQHGITIPLFLYEEMNKPFVKKKIWNASRICVSSLRRGHANLLCIVPILVYVFRRIQREGLSLGYIYPQHSAGLQIQVQSQTKVDSKMNTDEAKVRERSLDSYCHLRIYYRKYDIYISTIYLALFVRFCKD